MRPDPDPEPDPEPDPDPIRVTDHTIPTHWSARWIEPIEPGDAPDVFRPAYYLAGEFEIEGELEKAVLYATAHGIYEVFLNGRRVGDRELTPGFTAYRKRIQVQGYDVTDLINRGKNVLGALLSDGWWRGQSGILRKTNSYGTTTAFLAQLVVELSTEDTSAVSSGTVSSSRAQPVIELSTEDTGAASTNSYGDTDWRGTTETIVFGTDSSWLSAPSHIVAADLIAGEIHDQRRRIDGWATPGCDRSGWNPVRIADYGYEQLCPTEGPPVRRIEELPPISIEEKPDGSFVVDFGQNSNGWIRLSNLGPEGTEITVVYGEWLDPRGNVIQSNVAQGAPSIRRDPPIPFQTDKVISAGDGSTFEPRHSIKGFQFVQVIGHPGPLQPQDISSIVVHSDLARIGGFECSDGRINRLHKAAEWSFRSNACDIPTDCPTRERSGWTGDWQIFVTAAAFLYDVTEFSAKWLKDLEADQLPNGAPTSIVPDPNPDAPIWKESHGSSGWGDAAVHVPWEIYLATGREDILRNQFESMKRWVDFAAERAATGRHPSRIQRSKDPLEHERFIWDTGWHFGEWLEPGVEMDNLFARLATEDHGPVATAYLYRSARELGLVAGVLGIPDAQEHYFRLSQEVLRAWRVEFIDEEGVVHPRTQANLVRALAFGLVPESLAAKAAADLVDLIREADNHLSTGFLSTPFLLPVLADYGYPDIAYGLLFQDTEPSWLYMIDKGATTIWEDWNAIRPPRLGRPVAEPLQQGSRNLVSSPIRRWIAALRARIPPLPCGAIPGGGIVWAETYHDSPYGRIQVRWELGNDGSGVLDVRVPEGTTAELVLPDGHAEELAPGSHQRSWHLP